MCRVLNVYLPHCVESKIQCIKLCVYSHIHTVKTANCCVLTICKCECTHNFIHCICAGISMKPLCHVSAQLWHSVPSMGSFYLGHFDFVVIVTDMLTACLGLTNTFPYPVLDTVSHFISVNSY
jgi:hypothetical protein